MATDENNDGKKYNCLPIIISLVWMIAEAIPVYIVFGHMNIITSELYKGSTVGMMLCCLTMIGKMCTECYRCGKSRKIKGHSNRYTLCGKITIFYIIIMFVVVAFIFIDLHQAIWKYDDNIDHDYFNWTSPKIYPNFTANEKLQNIQMNLHCCGNNGIVDFNHADPMSSTMVTIPASCCGQWTSDDSWKKECNISDILYKQGCIGKLKSILINYLVTISMISIFLILAEITLVIYNVWNPDCSDLDYEECTRICCRLCIKDTTENDRINNFDPYISMDSNDNELSIEQQIQQDVILVENYVTDDEGNNDISRAKVLEAMIGEGAFGTVFRGKELATGTIFAIKQIDTKGLNHKERKNLEREIKTLLIVSSQYVVQYFDYWHEFDCLYIQMELCSDSLREILQPKRHLFNRQMGLPLREYEYIISCEMFRQILECVQYLHELNPQIIHRDLKPDNILIARNVRNGQFIKLGDFGLATIHDCNTHNNSSYMHTAQVGDLRFMAPEIMQGTKYNHKSDIYSLALIGSEIFDLDLSGQFNNLQHYIGDLSLNEPVHRLHSVLISMMSSPMSDSRPECSEVLAKYSEWCIDKIIIKNRHDYDDSSNMIMDYNSFFYKFFTYIMTRD